MDETATRRKKIDPKLYEVGWEQVPESEILTEQRAEILRERARKEYSKEQQAFGHARAAVSVRTMMRRSLRSIASNKTACHFMENNDGVHFKSVIRAECAWIRKNFYKDLIQ